MQLTNQQTLPVGQAQAWEALNDISLLQSAIPGCESITATGENQYEVLVTAAVGPVKAKFKGKLRLENLQPPTSYTLAFEGQGGAEYVLNRFLGVQLMATVGYHYMFAGAENVPLTVTGISESTRTHGFHLMFKAGLRLHLGL